MGAKTLADLAREYEFPSEQEAAEYIWSDRVRGDHEEARQLFQSLSDNEQQRCLELLVPLTDSNEMADAVWAWMRRGEKDTPKAILHRDYVIDPSARERNYREALADVAFAAGTAKYYSGDSRRDMNTIIAWADEFDAKYRDTDWGGVEYIDTMDGFMAEKLREPVIRDGDREKPICTSCGSDNIFFDATAVWDAEAQAYAMKGTSACTDCDDCDGPCGVKWIKLEVKNVQKDISKDSEEHKEGISDAGD